MTPAVATLEVVAPGPLTTVQDLGRPGLAALGVGRSGAADRAALRLANRLVGNAEDAAGLETTLGGLHLRTAAPVVLAVTGAPCPVTAGGRPEGLRAAFTLRAGTELRLGTPAAGLRSYVAVRGGVAVPPVLGSRSTDLLAGLGPDVLVAGTRLPVGPPPAGPAYGEVAPGDAPSADEVVLPVRLGPRDDWFSPASVQALLSQPWTVTSDTDRTGARLDGGPLQRALPQELASEAVVRGALQVPPTGLPVLLLADAPVTGGYPVVAVVLDAHVDRAAQARPGQVLRFSTSRPRGGRA